MTTVATILTAVGYRIFPDTNQSITTTSEPSRDECIQWTNETCQELLTVCVEMGTEIGRSTASITLADGTAAYTDLASTLLAPYEAKDKDGKAFCGWILKTNVRNPLILGTESDSLEFDPALESEPTRFYVNGSNSLTFLPTPDATYTANIPYYALHTLLTATTDTVPFLGMFDAVITESVAMRTQNRDEYDLSFELKWFKYIRGQARKIISMRKGETIGVTV
jgi:hypothetical protein